MLFDILNRLGIILNFFAGFMLAPQLIGEDRINKFENFLDKMIINQTSKIQANLAKNKVGFDRLILIYRNFTVSELYKGLFLNILIIFYPVFLIYKNNLNSFAYIITWFSILILVFCLLIQMVYILPVLLFDLVNKIEKFFQEDNNVLALLTFWGIIFFISGNLFQFIATFKPS